MPVSASIDDFEKWDSTKSHNFLKSTWNSKKNWVIKKKFFFLELDYFWVKHWEFGIFEVL